MKRLFPVAVIAFTIAGCGIKPPAKGSLDEIIVFADSTVYAACGTALANALERRIDTPQPETVFTLKPVPWNGFGNSSIAPLILLMATLNGEGEVSQYVQEMFDKETLKGVKAGQYWLFIKENPWRSHQLAAIICANDIDELNSRIRLGADEIFNEINEPVMKRLHDMLYSAKEQLELEKELSDKYGFKIRIQHDYLLVRDEPDEKFVRLRRFNPDRWLTISWVEADTLTDSLITAERRRLGGLFSDPTKLYPDYNRFQPYHHIYPNGIMLRGLWAAESSIGGGPFFTCALHSECDGKVYFIDGSVFAPGKDKFPFLQQLEIMARTFQPPQNRKLKTEN